MGFVKANPNEFLVVGRGGKIANLGTAVETFLWAGSVYVLVPSTRQETTFEITQESKDGIPLRFKGIVLYRVVDPVAVATHFNFTSGSAGGRGRGYSGAANDPMTEISGLINHICMGELRAVVAHMTMDECIEQRKTTLSTAIDSALRSVIEGRAADGEHALPAGAPPAAGQSSWGIQLELAQVAQVFIVDQELRRQLEAEVRNEIRLRSDQSDIHSREEIQISQLASERTLQERKQEVEKENLRRKEEMDLARVALERRMREEGLATERQQIEHEKERSRLKEEAERDQQERKLATEKGSLRRKEELELAKMTLDRKIKQEALETERQEIEQDRERFRLKQEAEQEQEEKQMPIRLLKLQNQRKLSEEELELNRLLNQIGELEAQREMLLEQARQQLRKEILPLEQTPAIAEAVASAFQGMKMSVYSQENPLMPLLAPLMDDLIDRFKGNGKASN